MTADLGCFIATASSALVAATFATAVTAAVSEGSVRTKLVGSDSVGEGRVVRMASAQEGIVKAKHLTLVDVVFDDAVAKPKTNAVIHEQRLRKDHRRHEP